MTVVILAHGDSDGVCSAALIKSMLREAKVYFTHPAGLLEDLQAVSGDEVYIVDVAISEPDAERLAEEFRRVTRRGRLVYIDHHPEPLRLPLRQLPGTIVHDVHMSTSELTYRWLEDRLESDMVRVALYGAIGDYLDETEWVRRQLRFWDRRSIYFEAGVLSQGLEGSRRMYDFKRHIVDHLSRNMLPSGLSELLIRALIESSNEEEMRLRVLSEAESLESVGYVLNPGGSISRAATYAMLATRKPVGVAGERRGRIIVCSVRTHLNTVDLNRVLREITPPLGGTGGGHSKAAGARIPAEKWHDFIRALNDRVAPLTHRLHGDRSAPPPSPPQDYGGGCRRGY